MGDSSENRFQGRTANIVAIEPSGAVRQLLTDVFRSKDFANVQAVANVKEAIHILEVESVDWIISSVLSDQDPNMMQLVRLLTENTELRHTRVSLIVSEDERDILPLAFENGILSYFSKPFNKDSLISEIDRILKVFDDSDGDDRKVAAFYLDTYLASMGRDTARVALCKAMLDIFPGQIEYLMGLVKPFFELDRKEEARSTLLQVLILDPGQEAQVSELHESLFPGENLQSKLEDGSSANILGLKDCVVVDADEVARKEIVEALTSIGAENIADFEDGEAAWKHLESCENPGIVIHEWRIPKLTGPLLVQRIRKKFPSVPILVVSSLLGDSDYPLVKEMGVVGLIKKPVERADLMKSLVHTIQQERMPTDVETLERKIRQALEMRKMEEATSLRETYQKTPADANRRSKIEAEFAYAQGKFELSRDLALKAIATHKDSISLLNLLGKVFMQLQDFNAALKCFEKAQTMSPMNIQRLCAIAEVNSELGNSLEAETTLDTAKELDDTSESVVETTGKIALSEGDIKLANAMMAQLDSIGNILSYSNNKAIAYARGQQVDEGIQLYKSTIESIPASKKALIPLVEYNLALAYIRSEMYEESTEILKSVINRGSSRVLDKAKSLISRLELSQKKGKTISLSVGDSGSSTSEESGDDGDGKALKKENEVFIAKVDYRPGDLCCYMIYVHPEHHDPKHLSLMSKSPHFTRRETIEREESGAAGRMAKGD